MFIRTMKVSDLNLVNGLLKTCTPVRTASCDSVTSPFRY
jgi:hypothetical protein